LRRFNLTGAPPNNRDKPTAEQEQQRKRNDTAEQTHPSNSIKNRLLKKGVA
jgi:hypothetical protein